MSIPSLATPIKPLRPGPVRPGTTAISSTTKALNGTRTVSAGHPPPKSPIKGLFDIPKWTEDDAHKVQPSISRSTTLMSSPIEGDSRYEVQQGTSPVKAAEISPKRLGGGTIRLPPHSPVRPVDKSPRSSGNGPVIPLASQALRETIAKAKAARRSIEKNNAFVPRFVEEESKNIVPMNAGLGLDLGIIDVTENATTSLIKQRIRTARKDGKLNIAALGLHEIPREVLRMYDFDEKSDTKWYENVDLTRLIAADNEIAELREEDFPEESLESFDAISDEASSSVFAGLELMDLHGNQLKALPAGLGKLYRLTTLNLNRNKLNDGCLGVVFGILSLKELRIGENSLTGILPSSISDLQSLEILDIHGNSITELPDSIGKLSNLKTLDVSGNRLSSLPFEAIFDLPLVEILARKNRLSGALIPSNVTRMESLKTLEAANNALQSLTEASIEFPALQTIDISNNRISALPAVSSWAQAITINVQENKISALPQGFTTLKKLKLADFSDNSLLHIEDEIALMENLAMLRISNNPIRERRFLKMSTEDVKAELKARLEAPQSPASVRSGFGSIDRAFDTVSSTWVVKSGILDRSSSRLKKINAADLEPIRSEDISSLILHHNWIQEIPMSIGVLGNTLTTLDLSHNKLGKSCDFLSTPLSLPNLQVLNLTSNALTTLDPLVTHLSAPKLTTLILLFNRLTSLPLLCPAFPALTKLLASNNAIATLNVNGLRNLQVLDVSSNEIEKLPPQLALLQGQLRTLMINGNKFRVPGWGILEKGTEAILDWCRLKIPAGQEGNMDG
jgi:Leucine-rich repeat (LRR) protein